MLRADLDPPSMRQKYLTDDRIRIDNLLDSSRLDAVTKACANLAYDYIFFSQDQNHAVPEAEMAKLTMPQREQLQNELNSNAAKGVGFLYGGYRMEGSKVDEAPEVLRELFNTINSEQMLSKVREISGIQDLESASGQYTRYTPGHYLTRHSDQIPAEARRVAYVLSLTPTWHPDSGGLLQFYEKNGVPRDAWEPRHNSLSLFDVRHIHSVTYVTPWAPPRFSLTGWFSSQR